MAEAVTFSSFNRARTSADPAPIVPARALDVPPILEVVADAAEPAFVAHAKIDKAEFMRVQVDADQLGLASPQCVQLMVGLQGFVPVLLDADISGLYRPLGFRAAPWSGSSYDQPAAVRTGVASGTRILTARGEIAVEDLVPTDAALALRGPALLPIVWIGRSSATVPLVWIDAGALGPNRPRRTIRLGPDQGVFVEPTPVAAHTLVNGTTIRLADNAGSVAPPDTDLFHIDLGRSEILFAEGLALSGGERNPVDIR